MNGRLQRGFTLLELLVAFSILCMFVLLGVSILSTRPGEARAAALGFQALLRDVHATSQNNGDVSQPINGTGATIAVSESNGETVLQLYRNGPTGAGMTAGADASVPPVRMRASLRLLSMNVDPPFLFEVAPTGLIRVTQTLGSVGSAQKMSCLPNGVIVEFRSGSRSERHMLNCLTGTIDVNEFLSENASSLGTRK